MSQRACCTQQCSQPTSLSASGLLHLHGVCPQVQALMQPRRKLHHHHHTTEQRQISRRLQRKGMACMYAMEVVQYDDATWEASGNVLSLLARHTVSLCKP